MFGQHCTDAEGAVEPGGLPAVGAADLETALHRQIADDGFDGRDVAGEGLGDGDQHPEAHESVATGLLFAGAGGRFDLDRGGHRSDAAPALLGDECVLVVGVDDLDRIRRGVGSVDDRDTFARHVGIGSEDAPKDALVDGAGGSGIHFPGHRPATVVDVLVELLLVRNRSGVVPVKSVSRRARRRAFEICL